MQNPIINPATKKVLDNIVANAPQSILLSGEVGVGLGTIARHLASKFTKIPLLVLPEKDDKVDLVSGSIKVSRIRELYRQTSSIQADKQVVVIDYAERMAPSAQNAFLKLLEEPGNNVHFILATHRPSNLLPTITSRVQAVNVRRITSKQTESLLDYFRDLGATKKNQIMFMAEGLPAEITRLAESEEYFEARANIMRDARDLLRAKTYDKLVVANKYSGDREKALELLTDASNILRRSINDRPDEGLVAKIDKLLQAQQRIQANGNIRLCLARLVV